MKWVAVMVGALGLVMSGCALQTPGRQARNYVRPQLADLPLQSIDMLIVARGPAVSAGPRFEVEAFPPPTLDTRLAEVQEDSSTHTALTRALKEHLEGLGFRVGRLSADPSVEPTQTATVVAMPLIETSTVPTSTAAKMVAVREVRRVQDGLPSPGGDPNPRLEQMLQTSRADAVLIVRVVLVDRFFVYDDTQAQLLAAGAVDAPGVFFTEEQALPRSGRLLIGQAFLFDRQTGLRLWTRHLPDVPFDGIVQTNAALLDYGFVDMPGRPRFAPQKRAEVAAQRWVPVMFKNFPTAQTGVHQARQRLAEIDPDVEAAAERFFDDTHVSFELDAGWGWETIESRVQFARPPMQEVDDFDTDVVRLDQKSLAPQGILRATPRIGYQFVGGTFTQLAVPLGISLGEFRRTYFVTDPDDVQGFGRGTSLDFRGLSFGGLELIGGQNVSLSPEVFLRPHVGVFAEFWSSQITPTVAVDDQGTMFRGGIIGGIDLLYRFIPTGPLFFRTSGRARIGLDDNGPQLIYGVDLSAGVGLFL